MPIGLQIIGHSWIKIKDRGEVHLNICIARNGKEVIRYMGFYHYYNRKANIINKGIVPDKYIFGKE